MADAAEDRNPIVFFDVTLGGACRFLQMVMGAPLTPRHPPLRIFLRSSLDLVVVVPGKMFLRSASSTDTS